MPSYAARARTSGPVAAASDATDDVGAHVGQVDEGHERGVRRAVEGGQAGAQRGAHPLGPLRGHHHVRVDPVQESRGLVGGGAQDHRDSPAATVVQAAQRARSQGVPSSPTTSALGRPIRCRHRRRGGARRTVAARLGGRTPAAVEGGQGASEYAAVKPPTMTRTRIGRPDEVALAPVRSQPPAPALRLSDGAVQPTVAWSAGPPRYQLRRRRGSPCRRRSADTVPLKAVSLARRLGRSDRTAWPATRRAESRPSGPGLPSSGRLRLGSSPPQPRPRPPQHRQERRGSARPSKSRSGAQQDLKVVPASWRPPRVGHLHQFSSSREAAGVRGAEPLEQRCLLRSSLRPCSSRSTTSCSKQPPISSQAVRRLSRPGAAGCWGRWAGRRRAPRLGRLRLLTAQRRSSSASGRAPIASARVGVRRPSRAPTHRRSSSTTASPARDRSWRRTPGGRISEAVPSSAIGQGSGWPDRRPRGDAGASRRASVSASTSSAVAGSVRRAR